MKKLAKLGEARCFTLNGKNAIVSLVPLLLEVGLPLAIFWLVIAIIVLPSKGEPRRTITHISQEVLKSQPAFTYSNSTSTIILPAFVARLCAPLEHSEPNVIRGCFRSSMGCEQATTRPCFTSNQHVVGNYGFAPAVADTSRVATRILGFAGEWGWGILNHKELAEPPADDIQFSRHNFGLSNFMFSIGGPTLIGLPMRFIVLKEPETTIKISLT